MKCTCGCCGGIEILTPALTANRSGLPMLSYRVGTHASFLETMLARLSSSDFPELAALKTRDSSDPAIALLDSWALVADVLTFYQERIANEGYLRTATERRSILEMARLIGYTLRPGVASTAFLAYTMDEDRSTTPPKPTAVTIPLGSRSQSVPGPGELPQSFETSDELDARSEWNNLQVRLTQPQTEASILNTKDGPRIYFKGASTNLKPNDPLLIELKDGPNLFRVIEVKPNAAADRTLVILQEWKVLGTSKSLMDAVTKVVNRTLSSSVSASKKLVTRFQNSFKKFPATHQNDNISELVAGIEKDVIPAASQTLKEASESTDTDAADAVSWLQETVASLNEIILRVSTPTAGTTIAKSSAGDGIINRDALLTPLLKAASIPPQSSARLARTLSQSFTGQADTAIQLLGSFQPALNESLASALANSKVTDPNPIRAYALRVKASLFGNNVPREPQYEPKLIPGGETSHSIPNPKAGNLMPQSTWPEWIPDSDESGHLLFLDADYDQITPGGYVAILEPTSPSPMIYGDIGVRSLSRNAYGISGKSTVIALPTTANAWWTPDTNAPGNFYMIRRTTIYAKSEELELAEEPIDDPICHGQDTSIELNDVYSGLQSGRWLIVSGERTDIVGTSGVRASELVMLAGVTHAVKQIQAPDGVKTMDLSGDKTHTFIQLSDNLAYCYKRDSVVIYGNVVKATHGETRSEVLGSGDGNKALQQFALRQPPLTFVSAANPTGVDSTLVVRVNDIQWHETSSLAGLVPKDRKFITKTDDDGKTTVIFGNGQRGARLPTGQENVKAVYRNGIGKPGNVKADQITLLSTRPLGVKAVTNPLRASGGADKEDRDQARRNAPVAVTALDRLVSTQDYADFARTFAGIGKATAARLSDGQRQVVFVTIAGADDIPIEKSSDLYRNLVKALHDFGDPHLAIQVELRELLALVISANVRIMPDYQWESVEPKIRATLLDVFGFESRELGQTVYLSEVISTIQKVAGVSYVDVDLLGSLSESELSNTEQLEKKLKELTTTTKPAPYLPVRLAEPTADGITPSQLAFLTPDVPDTLILRQVTR
jgi:hypothetical protein